MFEILFQSGSKKRVGRLCIFFDDSYIFSNLMHSFYCNITHSISRDQGLMREYCHILYFSISFFIYLAPLSSKIFFTFFLHLCILFQSTLFCTILFCTSCTFSWQSSLSIAIIFYQFSGTLFGI